MPGSRSLHCLQEGMGHEVRRCASQVAGGQTGRQHTWQTRRQQGTRWLPSAVQLQQPAPCSSNAKRFPHRSSPAHTNRRPHHQERPCWLLSPPLSATAAASPSARKGASINTNSARLFSALRSEPIRERKICRRAGWGGQVRRQEVGERLGAHGSHARRHKNCDKPRQAAGSGTLVHHPHLSVLQVAVEAQNAQLAFADGLQRRSGGGSAGGSGGSRGRATCYCLGHGRFRAPVNDAGTGCGRLQSLG